MTSKANILADIIKFRGDVMALKEELSTYNWDSLFPVIKVSVGDVQHVIDLFLDGNIDAILLENWANIIECREDIEYENEAVQEMITELANPVLYGNLSVVRANEIRRLNTE